MAGYSSGPDPVSAALQAVPREQFLPPVERDRAAYDGPLPIGHGQTNSQPRTVADMLRLLQVDAGQRVLDVGSGSGWTAALLARLVGTEESGGSVIGVELEPELVAFGRENLRRTGVAGARIEQAEAGVLGWPAEAPYERILVSAEATSLPGDLVEQLAPDGRMVIPVNGRMVLLEPGDPGEPRRVSAHGWYRFVPLR